jgi:hypothetical protein
MNKEFFFPIRQQIMPYLQKMLDWVRDHRALFAKWGQAVADALKIVIDVGKTLWNTLKDVVKILTDSLQKGLGTSFKSLDEFISVLQVKIAFVTMLIGDAIKIMFEKISPTLEFIIEKGSEILKFFVSLASSWLSLNGNGSSLVTVLDKVYNIFDKIVHIIGDSLIGFLDGLIPPLKNLITPIDNVADSFLRLLNIFGEDENSGLRNVFKWLGNLTGNVLVIAFEELAWAIDTVVVGVQTLAQSGKLLVDLFSGNWSKLGEDWENMKNVFKGYGERTSATGQRQVNAFASMFGHNEETYKKMYKDMYGTTQDEELANILGIDDGIITKQGQVIKLNPEDNIYAFKNADTIKHLLNKGVDKQLLGNIEEPKLETPTRSISAPMNMVFNVTVTEGNAQAVGQQLGYSIHKSFVDLLKEQQMAGGW